MQAPTSSPTQRDELVRAAERRVLYAALWDRADADELRALLPPDAIDGRAALVWALIEHHDATADPWPGDEPATSSWSGPGRVLAILATALQLDVSRDAARLDRWAATMRPARQVGVNEHELACAAVEPADGWTLDLPTACRVLRIAPAYRAAALALTQLDAIAAAVLVQPAAPLPQTRPMEVSA